MINVGETITLGLRGHSTAELLRNADGVGGINFSRKKCYKGVRFNECY